MTNYNVRIPLSLYYHGLEFFPPDLAERIRAVPVEQHGEKTFGPFLTFNRTELETLLNVLPTLRQAGWKLRKGGGKPPYNMSSITKLQRDVRHCLGESPRRTGPVAGATQVRTAQDQAQAQVAYARSRMNGGNVQSARTIAAFMGEACSETDKAASAAFRKIEELLS